MAGRAGRMIGRDAELRTFERALDALGDGGFVFTAVTGEPGVGKTRLLGALAAAAERRNATTLWGRAAEFERETPFGVMVDALDDQVAARADTLSDDLGAGQAQLLATVFPSLSAPAMAPGAGAAADLTGLARYRLFRSVGQLLGELGGESGLVLILDDVHWADETAIEFLDHLVWHPPRGRTLIAVGFRPAQAPPRLITLVGAAAGPGAARGFKVPVPPFSRDEVREFLGPDVSRARCEALHEASGGNPFYLEALAHAPDAPVAGGGDEGGGLDELPHSVRASLQVEFASLSATALLAARAAAVAGESFEPALVAVAAELTEDAAFEAFNELAERDIVRVAGNGGRFRFRHSLVRAAAYAAAGHGWRLAAHARIAAYLADLGAPVTARAPHVERSAQTGDQAAVATLVQAARAVASHAPATAAHWLAAALRLTPEGRDAHAPAPRPELLLELARLQVVSGQVVAGRDTARTALRSLSPGDHGWRARAVWVASMMERLLGHPDEARALIVDEIERIGDPRSPAAVPLRVRLAAEYMFRGDYRAAHQALGPLEELPPAEDRGLAIAVAALRPLPAYAAGRHTDAVRHMEAADRLLAGALDEHVAEWMDPVAFLCWTGTILGRPAGALAWFDRAVQVARSTGQSYVVSNLLAGQAGTFTVLGRLAEASIAAEEATAVARLLGSRMQTAIAITQQCLAASWSGDADAALRLGADAVREAADVGEWWGRLAGYAQAIALINAGRTDEGARALLAVSDSLRSRLLDPFSLLCCCEVMARLEAERDRPREALACADRAARFAHPNLPANTGLTLLARAHALCGHEPEAAAEHAREAARLLDRAGLRIGAARARQRLGLAHARAGDRGLALDELRAATEIFAACGARGLSAETLRERRRLGERVHRAADSGQPGPSGLSRREMEVAQLVAESYTNQQIAEKLYLSSRTIETHLSRIFTKLGVTSRAGVVTALHRR